MSINCHMPYFLNSAPTRGACLRRCTIRWQWDANQNGLTCKRVFCMRCMPISIFFQSNISIKKTTENYIFFISVNEPSLSKEAYHSELLICRTSSTTAAFHWFLYWWPNYFQCLYVICIFLKLHSRMTYDILLKPCQWQPFFLNCVNNCSYRKSSIKRVRWWGRGYLFSSSPTFVLWIVYSLGLPSLFKTT